MIAKVLAAFLAPLLELKRLTRIPAINEPEYGG